MAGDLRLETTRTTRTNKQDTHTHHTRILQFENGVCCASIQPSAPHSLLGDERSGDERAREGISPGALCLLKGWMIFRFSHSSNYDFIVRVLCLLGESTGAL